MTEKEFFSRNSCCFLAARILTFGPSKYILNSILPWGWAIFDGSQGAAVMLYPPDKRCAGDAGRPEQDNWGINSWGLSCKELSHHQPRYQFQFPISRQLSLRPTLQCLRGYLKNGKMLARNRSLFFTFGMLVSDPVK